LTGLVGVVGLVVKLVVVVGGLEGERLEVSRRSLRLPIVASDIGCTGVMVTVISFLLSSYLGDQRGRVNVVGVVVAVVPVAEEDGRDAVYESSE